MGKKTGIGDTTAFLADVRNRLGDETARRIRQFWAGRQLHVAANPGPWSALVVQVGIEAAQELGRHYGGQSYSIPLGEFSRHARDRAEIEELCLSGLTAEAVAARVGRDVRTVYYVRADLRARGLMPPKGSSGSKNSQSSNSGDRPDQQDQS